MSSGWCASSVGSIRLIGSKKTSACAQREGRFFRGHYDEQGSCHLEGEGPSIASETAQRICCDSNVVPLPETADGRGLDIHAVGRKRRTVPPSSARALLDHQRALKIDADTVGLWEGDPLDYAEAIDVLMFVEHGSRPA